MKKLRRRQNLWNKLRRRQDFFDWILMCTRFFWLNPGPIAFHWENGEIRCGLWRITQRQSEIRCGLWGITQKKVWAAGSPLSLSGQWSPSLYELWSTLFMNIYYQHIRFLHIDLHSTPGRTTVNSCTSFSSFCMPSGASAKIEKSSMNPMLLNWQPFSSRWLSPFWSLPICSPWLISSFCSPWLISSFCPVIVPVSMRSRALMKMLKRCATLRYTWRWFSHFPHRLGPAKQCRLHMSALLSQHVEF